MEGVSAGLPADPVDRVIAALRGLNLNSVSEHQLAGGDDLALKIWEGLSKTKRRCLMAGLASDWMLVGEAVEELATRIRGYYPGAQPEQYSNLAAARLIRTATSQMEVKYEGSKVFIRRK